MQHCEARGCKCCDRRFTWIWYLVIMPSVSLRHMHHAGDSPLAPVRKEVNPPTPIFSFCKTPEYSDIMIPNTIEGDVFVRPAAKRAFRPQVKGR